MSKNLQLQVVLSAIDKATAPIKSIMKSSGGLGAQLKQTRDQLKGLQAQQANIQSFKTLKDASEQSKKAMSEQQQKIKELSAGMRQAEAPTKAMTKEFQAATREAHRLKQNHNANTQQLQSMRGKLNEAGISTNRLGDAERNLHSRISATNKSLTDQQNRLKRVTDQQKRLSAAKASYEKSTQLAAGMTTAGAGAIATGGSVLYGGAKLLQEGMQFDATMSKVQAMSGLSKDDEQMQMLRDQAKQLGAETMFSANDAGRGQTFLAVAGFTPESIRAAMPGLLDMALAGDIALERTADIASNVLGGFKFDASEMGRVSDVLTKTFISSNTSLESLGETMKYVGPVAKKAGVSLETTAAMAGLLGNVGIQGSSAGTALKSMLLNLSGPASTGQKALKKLGVAAMDSAGDLRMPELILADLAKATEKLGSAKQLDYLKQVFGKEPAAAMAELMGEAGLGGLQDYIKDVQKNSEVASKTAKTMGDNLVGDIDQLSSAWSGLKIDVFEGQNSDLREMTQNFTALLGKIAVWIQANSGLVATAVKATAVIAGMVVAGGALMLTLGSLLGPLAMVKYAVTVLGIKSLSIIPAIKGIGTAVMVLGKAMLTSPLGIFMVLAAVAAVMIIKHWDLVKAFFKGFIGGFMQGFESMGRALADTFKPLIPTLKVVMKAGSAALKWVKDLLEPVTSAQEKLDAAGVAGKSFGEVIGALAALTAVALVIKTIGAAFLFMGKAVLANPIVAAVALLAVAAYMIYKNWAPIKEFFVNLWNGVSDYLVGMWSQIKAAFSGGIGGIFALLVNWSPLGLFYKAMAGVLGYFGVELPGTFSEFGSGLINSFTAGLSTAWSSITEFFMARFEDIKTAFGGGIGGISALIVNWSPLGLFYQVFAGVMSYFGVDLPSKFSEFGGMIMQGLINGIKDMAGGVKDAVVGMGDSVGGWFKDKLGIKSPSRVFMQFGDDTAEGLALGIAANKDSPLKQVAGMAKQVAAVGAVALSVGITPAIADNKDISQSLQPATLSAAQDKQQALLVLTQNVQQMITSTEEREIIFDTREPISSTPTATPQPSVVNNNNSYTINISGDSKDSEQIAREVMAHIERFDKQRSRSRLGDLD